MRAAISIGLGCFLALLSAAAQTKADGASRPPNILLIMADDLGYWDVGIHGNTHIDTPRLDQLARDGVRFSRFYVEPVCAPTRAGVMTGRYYLRTGLYNTRFGGDTMGAGEITVAQLLKRAGYRTGLFGKWHLGKYEGYQPQQRGFDTFFGHYHGHIERYDYPDQLVSNGEPVEARGYVSDLFADAAIDFIEACAGRGDPFFCFLSFNAPHSPWLMDTSHSGQPEGDKLIEKYLGRGLPLREARIYAMVERVDENVGRVFARIDALGLRGDTVVLFMSDNGGVSEHFKAGLKGNKAQTYEGGVRSPLFVRWPGRFPAGGVVEGQASHVDLLPTFCEIAGVEAPGDRAIDGKSLFKLLEAGAGAAHHEFVYHTWDRFFPNPDRRWAVSDQRYKLVAMFGEDAKADPAQWRLYDLASDPAEEKNVAKEHPEKVKALRAEFVRWFEDVTRGVTYEPVPVPVSGEAPVEIQPSWARWHGDSIEYVFEGYDWDTIEGWKSPGEYAAWDLDVRSAGVYEVEIAYGCRHADAGGLLRISAGGNAIEFQPKATPTADTFVRRAIGTIELGAGAVELKAEAGKVIGSELMRLNRIWLRKTQ